MGKFIVYSVRRLSTGEQYIGCTKSTLLRRRNDHLSEARNRPAGKLHAALRADGVAGFQWEVEREFDCRDDALAYERSLIVQRNTIAMGLNTDPGGSRPGGRRRTEEERAHLRAIGIERTHRPGFGDEIGGKLRAFYATPEGKRQLAARKLVANRVDVRASMSAGHGGRSIEALRDGVLVATYVSQGQCAQALRTSQGNVWAVLAGRGRSIRGFQLRYAAEGEAVSADPRGADPAILA